MCPSDFTCLADPNDDNKLKCIISPLISANNPLTITIKEESAIKEFHKASNLESEKPDFPIKFCNVIILFQGIFITKILPHFNC